MRTTRTAFCRMLLIGLLPLSGCGAGLITGVAVSNSGNPDERVPELSVSPVLPLVPAPGTTRTVVVANAQIAAGLRVRLEGAGAGQDQLNPTPSIQGGSTQITFTLDTAAIVAAVGDPTAADVDGQLSVFVGDQLVAPAVPVKLAAQPRAELVLGQGQQELFVSPLGERVQMRVHGLRSTEVAGLEVLVTTPDPTTTGSPQAMITRLASDVRFELGDGGGDPVISAFVPGNTFPVRAVLVVRDFEAGQSTPIENAFYRPNIALALPHQGPTTGGSLVTLIGTALVPLDFSVQGTPTFKWDDLELSFERGDPPRITTLAQQDLRTAESGSDHLTFTMPPSPDGRPGRVDIVLRVKLGDQVWAEVTEDRVFLFSNPDPFFGPRGTVLERLPVTVAPIALDGAPTSTGDAPDFVALTDPGGVAHLQLLLAQQNGMFQRFAAPRKIGNHEIPAERLPRDLCIGDFNGDQVPDIYIANEGAATAVHYVVLGQARPEPPLGSEWPIDADPGTWKCRTAFFDSDSLPDVLLVPGPNAPVGQLPQVRLARPLPPDPFGFRRPAFADAITVPLPSFRYEAVEVADLDGDGNVDVAAVSGTELLLQVAWGHGDGTFELNQQQTPNFTIPTVTGAPPYVPHVDSVAVGLHACRDGPLQSLGLVLSGVEPTISPNTYPLVTVFHQSPGHLFDAPLALQTTVLQGLVEPIGLSLVADLDDAGPVDMVLAMRGEPVGVSLGLLKFRQDGFRPGPGSIVAIGAESPRKIRAVAFDRAFPATGQSPDKKAVFVVHETEIDASTERRLSTFLVKRNPALQEPRLLPPDAGDSVGFGIQNIVGGNFHDQTGGVAARDLALVQQAPPADEIVLVKNDGFGGAPDFSNRLAFPGILPDSLTLLPSPPGQFDRLLFCGSDSRLGVWQRDPPPPAPLPEPVYQPIDALSAPLVPGATLADTTRMQVGDVDGDGIPDLVVLLSFALPTPGETARLALLRGKPQFASNEFPFFLPTTLTPVHGNASSITLGDFTKAGPGQPMRLELAVAVPVGTSPGAPDGDHIRFFRYVAGATPADDRFEPSALPVPEPQVLLAGSGPTQIVSGDFDRDGLVDLLVACKADSTLRLFRNTAPVTSVPGHVDVRAFEEGLTSPRPLAPGVPTVLRLGDLDGDGSVDCVVWVEATSGTARSTTVASYLSSGAGEFVGPRFASPTRIGNRDATLAGDLGDWNGDGLPDLLLGWNTSGAPNDINLRVMFGGTR